MRWHCLMGRFLSTIIVMHRGCAAFDRSTSGNPLSFRPTELVSEFVILYRRTGIAGLSARPDLPIRTMNTARASVRIDLSIDFNSHRVQGYSMMMMIVVSISFPPIAFLSSIIRLRMMYHSSTVLAIFSFFATDRHYKIHEWFYTG